MDAPNFESAKIRARRDSCTWTVCFSRARRAISGVPSLSWLECEWRSIFCTEWDWGCETEDLDLFLVVLGEFNKFNIFHLDSFFGAIAGHLQGCPPMSHPKGRRPMARFDVIRFYFLYCQAEVDWTGFLMRGHWWFGKPERSNGDLRAGSPKWDHEHARCAHSVMVKNFATHWGLGEYKPTMML